ncbi:hypothetical protein O5O45_00010 [Hahella aquimaris]|uniref:hypothetical protein n=1 Tax=Hahella sp. HNIBRBA332 TaxID=3015983 RepID=UPI00273AF00B|nr:hypothetical protein [Hahella sp. HNIBRBA332]WLQ14323.1 hypothetical protein O5O45_00010 [Hahella sp. HNIBRBA332]
MPIIRQFVRHTSVDILREYFHQKLALAATMNGENNTPETVHELISWAERLPPNHQIRLRVDAERVQQMSDDIGQAALLDAVGDAAWFKAMASSWDRSLWTFLHEPEKFRQAEDIRYADHYRHGRNWSGYQVEAALVLHVDPVSLDDFKARIKALFGLGEKVKVELFDRTMPDEEGQDIEVVQVMVYQEGLPDAYLEFEEEDSIVSRIRRPVSEHAIIYSPTTGSIEVVAAKRERRDAIVLAFSEHLLKRTAGAAKAPLRRYRLEPLVENAPLDWDLEDGIESVEIVMLKLTDIDQQGRVTLEKSAKGDLVLHEYCHGHFDEYNPVTSTAFIPVQATLSIRFQPEQGSRRGKVLPVKISLPNGCDLRSRTEHERLIGEKYLRRWGLLEEVAE